MSVSNSVRIAVVAPVYRSAEFLGELCSRLHAALESIDQNYEIVLVDDASPDNAWERIVAESAADPRVRGIQLSRNFGQHAAITAGLDHSDADWVVIIDADLQDRPEDIPLLYAKAMSENLDVVVAERSTRKDPAIRKIASAVYYRILGLLSGLELDHRQGNFRILKRNVVSAIRQTREQVRFFPAIMQVIGFRTGYQQTHREERNGSSSYDARRLLRLAYDVTLSHSERPVHIGLLLGLLLSLGSLLVGALLLMRTLPVETVTERSTTILVAMGFAVGLQTVLTSLVGVYVIKTFVEAKRRPLYFIRETTSSSAGRGDLERNTAEEFRGSNF